MESIFYITYEDSTSYEGGNTYDKMGWITSPKDKKIKSLVYRIPNSNDAIILSGYEKYYIQVEVTQDLNGERKGIINLECVYVMGILRDKLIYYRLSLKDYSLSKYELDASEDLLNSLNPDFWR